MRALPLLLLLGGWISLPAHATTAQDWLDRLAQAEQKQGFQGTFIYERNGSFSTHGIWHRVEGGTVRERLLQLDGSPQEVSRINGQTQCVSGSLVDGLDQAPAAPARALDASKLSALYDINVIGDSRVAGRAAVIIALTPRDQHRYGFELHLDKQTGLPLKSLLLNDKGQLLERFQYTHLDTNAAISDADLTPSADCHKVNLVPPQSVAPSTWHSDWLPDGFVLTGTSQFSSAQSRQPVTSLMFNDGLARFSVFIEALDGAKVEDARSQFGPTVAVSRRVSAPNGDVMVTVVGEIPGGTAERIALSMRNTAVQAGQADK